MKKRLAVLTLPLATSGCALAGPLYTQPDLPPSQVAVLEGDARSCSAVSSGWSVHTVTLRYGSATRTGRPIPVRFEAEAGHVYRANATVDGNRWIVWIEDSKTGEVVAGKKP